jgi:surface antigen
MSVLSAGSCSSPGGWGSILGRRLPRGTAIHWICLAALLFATALLVLAPRAEATEYTHTLQPGQRLYPGDVLYSPAHAYRLIMQGDGNLVLYSGATALWSSRTAGHDGASAVMQGDGNLVVYQSGAAIWNSGTAHHNGASLDMQDDGNLVIYYSGTAIWSTGTSASSPSIGGHVATPGQRLHPGEVLFSPSHQYRLVMQGDGNLVLYKGSKVKWSSGTQGHAGASAVMQGDGNLVIYWHGKAIWSTETAHHNGASLDLQDDGNLVIYYKGKAIWSSKAAKAAGGASLTGCLSYGYACTPGYDGSNARGTWPWAHYGGQYAINANGYHNCTLYAAWRLERNGLADPGNWGNAVEWIGHTIHNRTPAVGSIAWWGGGLGHVAYVEAIRGGEVFIRADNYAGEHSNGYTAAKWIAASSVGAFLHPHDLR